MQKAGASVSDERQSLLDQLEKWFETPMVILGFIWLVLTVLELTRGLSPLLIDLNTLIWIVFVVDFSVKFVVAPHKRAYLRKNWLTILALVVPAIRILRISQAFVSFRLFAISPGARLIKVLGTFNRSMHALGRTLGRHGFAYVIGLTFLVNTLGAAGIYAFEHEAAPYIRDYGTALWWTAMTLTTMGTDYFPVTAPGRLLCLFLATYGFAIFGYVTATVATYFVEQKSQDVQDPKAEGKNQEAELLKELGKIRQQLERLQRESGI